MKYIEFKVYVDGLEKKLGLLAETHIYTHKESEFAREIIKEYSLIASEGYDPDKIPTGMLFKYIPIMISGIPSYLALKYGTNRSSNNFSIRKIAEEYDKRLVRFNDTNIPLHKVLLVTAINILNIPLTPIKYIDYRINGDPRELGTKAYNREIRMKDNFFVKKFEQLIRYSANAEYRDGIMARIGTQLISEPENTDLLLNSGQGHFEGIIDNLHKQLDMKETGRYIQI